MTFGAMTLSVEMENFNKFIRIIESRFFFLGKKDYSVCPKSLALIHMFAEILINHAYSRKRESFTYKIPEDLEIEEGAGVIVPFQRGQKPGLVLRVHKE